MFLSISLNHPFSLLDEQGYVRAIAAKKLVPLYSLVVQKVRDQLHTLAALLTKNM